MMKYLKIYYRLLVYLTSFTVCSGDIKKCSENDQKTGLFQSFSFHPLTLNLKKKNSVNQLIKNSGHITYQAKSIMANLYKCREK